MISVPIWLFVLFCVFGFIGVITTTIIIYGVVISVLKPSYIYFEGDLQNEDDTTPN